MEDKNLIIVEVEKCIDGETTSYKKYFDTVEKAQNYCDQINAIDIPYGYVEASVLS